MNDGLIWEETEGLLLGLPGPPSFLHIFRPTVLGPTAKLPFKLSCVLMSLSRAASPVNGVRDINMYVYRHVPLLNRQ